jgi:transcriptional regulator with XRE-family HTH domain
VAEGLNISFQQVQKYENGINRVSASRIQAISKLMDVPPEFFFKKAPKRGRAKATGSVAHLSLQEVKSFLATSDGLAIARALSKVPPGRRCLGVDRVEPNRRGSVNQVSLPTASAAGQGSGVS